MRHPGFDPSPDRMKFVARRVALGQVLSKYLSFPCQFSFYQLLHSHQLPYHRRSVVMIHCRYATNTKQKEVICVENSYLFLVLPSFEYADEKNANILLEIIFYFNFTFFTILYNNMPYYMCNIWLRLCSFSIFKTKIFLGISKKTRISGRNCSLTFI
jgi:hypothetical protein